ncbi:MAG: 3-dehydroquinate synthase, partial [[Clostridium] scindens]
MKLTVNLGKDSYPIYIENNILSQAASYISEVFTGRRIIIIYDDHVYPLYGSPLLKTLS